MINPNCTDPREKRLAELEAYKDEIDRKLENLKVGDEEFFSLMKEFVAVSKEEQRLISEKLEECRALFKENCEIQQEINQMHSELEEAGFFDKLYRYDEILENPQNFSEEEVAEAEAFAVRLGSMFEENSEGG